MYSPVSANSSRARPRLPDIQSSPPMPFMTTLNSPTSDCEKSGPAWKISYHHGSSSDWAATVPTPRANAPAAQAVATRAHLLVTLMLAPPLNRIGKVLPDGFSQCANIQTTREFQLQAQVLIGRLCFGPGMTSDCWM